MIDILKLNENIYEFICTNCNYYSANVDGKSVSNWKKKKWLGQAIEFEDKTLRTSIEVEAI